MPQILVLPGVVYFTIAVMALHALRRDVNWRSQGISYYATGRHGWLMATAFAAFGFALWGVGGPTVS